ARAAQASRMNEVAETDHIIIRNRDARSFGEIPDCSVDYIFTDPPFGGNIYYADASILVDAWLGELTDETKELVFNRQRRRDQNFKELADYGRGMAIVFRELQRVLKPGRWCSVEFNNSEGSVFEVIKQSFENAGF